MARHIVVIVVGERVMARVMVKGCWREGENEDASLSGVRVMVRTCCHYWREGEGKSASSLLERGRG